MIGEETGLSLASGQANVLIGTYAGSSLNGGSGNVILGLDAGTLSTTATDNVMIGLGAGRSANGSRNVFLGKYAGYGETGSDKLVIENGYTGADNATYALLYGEFDNNNLRINATAGINRAWSSPLWVWLVDGGSSPSYSMLVYKGAYAYGNGFVSASDERLKKDVKPLNNALKTITSINGISFLWDKEKYPDYSFNNNRQIGFLAQEVEKVLPELVTQDIDGFKGVAYDKMAAVLVEAIKEQQQIIEKQKSEIDQLREEFEQLKALVRASTIK